MSLRAMWRSFDALVDDLLARFVRWAEDLDRRTQAGEFGKWPWQK